MSDTLLVYQRGVMAVSSGNNKMEQGHGAEKYPYL